MNYESAYIIDLARLRSTSAALAGGKGANLGELMQIGGLAIPGGFCVTTAAFDKIVAETPGLQDLIDHLARLRITEAEQVATRSAAIRAMLEQAVIPADIQTAIANALAAFDAATAWAVRSSATAEDLPGASFAGQQDTFLNISGTEAVLLHIRKCWASLFTERAAIYRLQQGFYNRIGSKRFGTINFKAVSLSVCNFFQYVPVIVPISFTATFIVH